MKVALAEVSVVDEIFCQPTAILSLGHKFVSHGPRAHVYHRDYQYLRLVYLPPGLSSCSRRSIGMNIVFFSRVLPELLILPFLVRTFKATSNFQNLVQMHDNLHLLLKYHAVMQHHKYIDHPRH